jgi:hypothetical protein
MGEFWVLSRTKLSQEPKISPIFAAEEIYVIGAMPWWWLTLGLPSPGVGVLGDAVKCFGGGRAVAGSWMCRG